mmetsp:Transcript_5557/g.17787  ORF Transcript_5557/g.17787 Transcript_5557/m.17787 type:complete len:430 (+) Transcript_5557:234-1523(+)
MCFLACPAESCQLRNFAHVGSPVITPSHRRWLRVRECRCHISVRSLLQPGENRGDGVLVAVRLVEQLVKVARKGGEGFVLCGRGGVEGLASFRQADAVPRAVDEQVWRREDRGHVNVGCLTREHNLVGKAERGLALADERIVHVAVDHVMVAAEGTQVEPRGREFGEEGGHERSDFVGQGRDVHFKGRRANDHAGEEARRRVDGVDGDEAAHAVAQHECLGDGGVALTRASGEGEQVLAKVGEESGEETRALALAVALVVEGVDGEAVSGEGGGEVLVAAAVLAEAVRNDDYGARWVAAFGRWEPSAPEDREAVLVEEELRAGPAEVQGVLRHGGAQGAAPARVAGRPAGEVVLIVDERSKRGAAGHRGERAAQERARAGGGGVALLLQQRGGGACRHGGARLSARSLPRKAVGLAPLVPATSGGSRRG